MPQFLLNCISVALGASIGALIRYFAVLTLPLPVFIVNLLGSFLIGLSYQKFSQMNLSPHLLLFINAGFLGGLTTFSSFSLELLLTYRSGKIMELFVYAVSSVILCFFACFLGYKIKLN